jgi:hypothetical protein
MAKAQRKTNSNVIPFHKDDTQQSVEGVPGDGGRESGRGPRAPWPPESLDWLRQLQATAQKYWLLVVFVLLAIGILTGVTRKWWSERFAISFMGMYVTFAIGILAYQWNSPDGVVFMKPRQVIRLVRARRWRPWHRRWRRRRR